MTVDLLQLTDVAPPMGDLSFNSALSEPRAVWTAPGQGETAEADRRIVHSRVVRLPGSARLLRLGLRRAAGYHNCGSHVNVDWVTAFRLLARVDGTWRELAAASDLECPPAGEVTWHEFDPVTADGVIIELRACGIDGGWVPWGLAANACVLEGALLTYIPPARDRVLRSVGVDLTGVPAGVTARLVDGAVHFSTAAYSVGFLLSRPGLSHLGLADEDASLAATNVLHTGVGAFRQGPTLSGVGVIPALSGAVRCDLAGTCPVRGAEVTYDFTTGGQHYVLTWTAGIDGLTCQAVREAEADAEAWTSSAWTIATRNSLTPAHAIGSITQAGEAGLMTLPVAVNLPRFGTLLVEGDGNVTARFDAYRPQDYNTLELKLGETALPTGHYRLARGRHAARITLRPIAPPVTLRDDAPAVAARALARTYYTALTYRPEMATLSNNGASMPCAISMDTWTAFYFELHEPLPGFPAHELLRISLERWLDGGQSYADGRIVDDGKIHDAQDEYLMTGAAVLRGLADYLERGATDAWFHARLERIRTRLAAMRARDLDGDGLIESEWRTGVSGTGQWSTCWFDVTSFGWKDAFANAILYPALTKLAAIFARQGLGGEAEVLHEWAARLHAIYVPTFLNPATGWLAGWRCREDKLHDYAFLMVNGCAISAGLVPAAQARDICARLLAEMTKVGVPDATLRAAGQLVVRAGRRPRRHHAGFSVRVLSKRRAHPFAGAAFPHGALPMRLHRGGRPAVARALPGLCRRAGLRGQQERGRLAVLGRPPLRLRGPAHGSVRRAGGDLPPLRPEVTAGMF
ncbi:MAG: hypothetical protein ACO3DQ_00755 [Cephaloticoccus sp.]